MARSVLAVAAPTTITVSGVTYRLVPLTARAAAAVSNRRASGRSPLIVPEPRHGNGTNGAAVAETETPLPQRLRVAPRINADRKLGRPHKQRDANGNTTPTPQPVSREAQIEPVMMRQYLAGERYGIGKGTVKKWVALGVVESLKVGRMRLVVMSSLRRHLGLDK